MNLREEIESSSLYGRRRREGPEAPVLRAVLDYLNVLPQCKAWRQNVGGKHYVGAHGRRGYVKFGEAGMVDVTGIIRGVRLEVEVKAPGKEPSELQKAWLAFIRDFGGVSFWCDSIEVCKQRICEEYERRQWS